MNQLWFPEHHFSVNGISLPLGEEQMKIYDRSLQALLSSPLAHSRVLTWLASFTQIGELAAGYLGDTHRTEKSVPWIEVSLAIECRLGKGLLIIWPTKDLFKFWNLLQLLFFKPLNKKSLFSDKLLHCCSYKCSTSIFIYIRYCSCCESCNHCDQWTL